MASTCPLRVMSDEATFKVVLFYKYFQLSEKAQTDLMVMLRQVCEEKHLLGRILIAEEGINGTLAGSADSIDEFILLFNEHIQCGVIDWKFSIHRGKENPFLDISIRRVKEIVGTGDARDMIASIIRYDTNSFGGICGTGKHLNAVDFHQALNNDDKSKIVFDIRNQFEYDIGHFDGSISLGTYTYAETFSALDKSLEMLNQKDLLCSNIYMYCTGGIRCEKASAYLCSKGFRNVYQLEGGIHRYLEAFPDGGKFKGKNFVFDSRVAIAPVTKEETGTNKGENEFISDATRDGNEPGDVVGRCIDCQRPCDQYSGRNVCTVCRMPVLVCPACVQANLAYLRQLVKGEEESNESDSEGDRSLGEFHCHRHRDLKEFYYTDLSGFGLKELARQSAGIQQILNRSLLAAQQQKEAIRRSNKGLGVDRLDLRNECEEQGKAAHASSSTCPATLLPPSLSWSKNRRRTLRRQLEKIRDAQKLLQVEQSQAAKEATNTEHCDTNNMLRNKNDRVGLGFWRG